MSNDSGFQRSGSPALGTNAMSSQKAKNEAYFSRMGAENANRRDDLAPNQGGKYGGFGSQPDSWNKNDDPGAPPEIADFQKDPVAALTKGFGWLGASVSKVGKTGYEGWVKPGMQKVSYGQALRLMLIDIILARRGRHRLSGTKDCWSYGSDDSSVRCDRWNCFQPLRRGRALK